MNCFFYKKLKLHKLNYFLNKQPFYKHLAAGMYFKQQE